MTDLMNISKKLLEATESIAETIKGIDAAYTKKSQAEADYARCKASVAIGLRNGKEYELECQFIQNPPTTIMPDIIKGICWKELMAASQAEGEVKALNQKLDSLKTIQNGYQSINKHLA